MTLFDEHGKFVGEAGQAPKTFAEEDRQRRREKCKRRYTKRSYEKQLLVIVNDESLPPKERHEALLALGRSRGYQRRPTGKG
jgi:hypothetical protein